MNHPNETSLYNSSETATRLNSDNEQLLISSSETRVNDPAGSGQHAINVDGRTTADSSVQHSFLSFLHEARSQLGVRSNNLQTVPTSEHVHHQHHHQPEDSNVNRWRANLNNVLSFSAGPSTETIRSWIPRTGSFRYAPLSRASPSSAVENTPATPSDEASTSNDVIISFGTTSSAADRSENNPTASREPRISSGSVTSLSRPNSIGFSVVTTTEDVNAEAGTQTNQPSTSGGAYRPPVTPPPSPPRNQAELDDDNVVYEMAVKILSHLIRYLPFMGIVLIKSIYDHWLGIVDILFLHLVVYPANKSLCEQVAKMSQKSLAILLRDYLLITAVVVYRFSIAHSRPDWFGLLLNTADDPHSLGQLLHAVAVNDLILKLITIKIKILVTALPVDVIKHKPRGRLYSLIEAISQMYRSLVPVKSWLLYLLVSYSGLDIIVGMFLFSSLYMGAKAFEFVERGKFLKKAFCGFLRNVDYGRQPTKEELNEAGALCPICHDNYDTPVVLECNHIFCEVCVGTWFVREQTCPMCRAKVADDPTFQNGSTTLFYQLC